VVNLTMPFFEWTWYNVLLEGYFALTAPLTFVGQSKAEEGPVVWSKFAIGKEFTYPCSAQVGMLCKYVPALVLVGARTLMGYPFDLTTAMVGIHFTKRVLEVLFVHSYTGSPTEDLQSSSLIGGFYAMQAWCYYKDGVGASGALLAAGVACFCVGIVGNLWHHILLANLRKGGSSAVTDSTGKYKIPEGGLFGLATCPHYLFEVLGFWGIALTAMSLLPLTCAVHLTLFLSGQSSATTRWYQSKFGDKWPKQRKHIIPFVY